MSARAVRRRRFLVMRAPIGRVCVDISDQLSESELVAAAGAGWPTARVGAPAGLGAPSVLVPLAGAADWTSCSAAWPAAARIACVSLPCPWPITTPTAVTGCPPTVTLVKNARHPPAAESDPVLPAYPSA